jgi:hypothetical protein
LYPGVHSRAGSTHRVNILPDVDCHPQKAEDATTGPASILKAKGFENGFLSSNRIKNMKK